MNDKTLVKKSRRLSWLLRHGAHEAGLTMDEAGWAPVAQVLRILHLSEGQLNTVIAENNKRRLQRDGDRVRASQGHSLEGTPVTAVGMEASWQTFEGSELVWHGTNLGAAQAIAQSGHMHPGNRTHVHLASSTDSVVGKRANVAVLLGVDPGRMRRAGWPLFVSSNGVVLARQVPAGCIVAIRTLSRRAHAARTELTSAFGLKQAA